ncbi:MAG TPA: YicC/YloC family endoribonuclease [bacterium]|jgi:uncharacterized protein (TIGR00255 family)|nr:YicC/YloC family endoribonuclease [bacterium]
MALPLPDGINMHSMTGFGRGLAQAGTRTFTVEIRALNHRFGEYILHLPRELGPWEERIRHHLSSKLSRGRVEVRVSVRGERWPQEVTVDRQLAQAYISAAQQLSDDFSLEYDVTPTVILGLPQVVTLEDRELDLNLLWPACSAALEAALCDLIAMRRREGEALKHDLLACATTLRRLSYRIEEKAALVPSNYRNKLRERLATLDAEAIVDEARLTQEILLMAERADINEEIVRLRSHLDQLQATVELEEPVGRRLEFLLQEANREINTIGSKAQDIDISSLVVQCKAELEKMREQAQNIE